MERVIWLILVHLMMISYCKAASLHQDQETYFPINKKNINRVVFSLKHEYKNRRSEKAVVKRGRRQVDISDEWLTSTSTRSFNNIKDKSDSYFNSPRTNASFFKSLEIKNSGYPSLRKSSQEEKKIDSTSKNDTVETNPTIPTITFSKGPRLRDPCNETITCFGDFVQCQNGQCKCIEGYAPERFSCKERIIRKIETPGTDPTMIGVVIGLALMSVTLCIVMRLFAKARFRENRTIFNTANPRIINQSLKKGRKQLTGSHHHRTGSVTGESNTFSGGVPSTSKSYRPRRGSNGSIVDPELSPPCSQATVGTRKADST